MTTISKTHKKSLPKSLIFARKSKNFRPRCWTAEFRGLEGDLGLDFGGLGKVLGAPRGESVFGPTLTPKYLHKGSHTAHQKKYEKKGPRNWGRRHGGLTSGDMVKQPIPRKASLNIEENVNPANMA